MKELHEHPWKNLYKKKTGEGGQNIWLLLFISFSLILSESILERIIWIHNRKMLNDASFSSFSQPFREHHFLLSLLLFFIRFITHEEFLELSLKSSCIFYVTFKRWLDPYHVFVIHLITLEKDSKESHWCLLKFND